MAIPVQKETDKYINHPIFEKIYSFYSLADKAPEVDFFSTQYVYSHKKFGRRGLDLPDKLTQIQTRVTNITFNDYCNIEKN